MTARVALVTAGEHAHLDDDLPPIVERLDALAVTSVVVDWHDESFEWASVDLAVIRSTWDYSWQLPTFLAWAEHVAAHTTLANPLPVVRWNTDKRYLLELARHDVPVVPTSVYEPADEVVFTGTDTLVVKPVVSAGSRDTERYERDQLDAALAHARRLQGAGRAVIVQPYLPEIDVAGETGLVFVGDAFSHAFRKGPILRADSVFVEGLYREEDITPRAASTEELDVARSALDALAQCVPGSSRADLLYARVDVAPLDGRPVVLELELVEPSLFCSTDPGAAARAATAIVKAVGSLTR